MSWTLAVDFGTTYTTAAVATSTRWSRPRVELVTLDSRDATRISSAVWLGDDGEFRVGWEAQHQGGGRPARYEPTVKRRMGAARVWPGHDATATDLIAAILEHVFERSGRGRHGAPACVRLTHPAGWAQPRRDMLLRAATLAATRSWRAHDPPRFELLAEPVAAAIALHADDRIGRGAHVAVYDLGGGTFDAAIMRRTRRGFEVVGEPLGEDPLGGEDFDQALLEHLGRGPAGELEQWQRLMHPRSPAELANTRDLRTAVRRAKEALSANRTFDFFVPTAGTPAIPITREELEELIRDRIQRTVEVLVKTVATAGLGIEDLAGVYLTGGSSEIPLVFELVLERTGREPRHTKDPKLAVVLGAAGWRPRRSGRAGRARR